MTAPRPDRFQVAVPGVQADRAREITDRESAAGRRAATTAVLAEIDFRLRLDAGDWGESREYLPVLDIQMRVGFAGPVTAWYGVDAARRIVYVREFRLRGDPP